MNTLSVGMVLMLLDEMLATDGNEYELERNVTLAHALVEQGSLT